MSAKRGTYLIEFSDGTKIVCGNNYKPWQTHAVEYAWYKYGYPDTSKLPLKDLLVSVKFSDEPFVDDGGLKYATPKAYQEIIDEITAKDGKARTPFKDIVFSFSNADKKKLDKELKYWGLI
jgi:hypothetical protein